MWVGIKKFLSMCLGFPWTMADSADAGACKKTHPVQCSSLYKEDLVMLKGHRCRIVEKSTSKTDAKVHFVGTDIFPRKEVRGHLPFHPQYGCAL